MNNHLNNGIDNSYRVVYVFNKYCLNFKSIGVNRRVAKISRKTKIVDNGRLQYLRSRSFEMYVNVVFVIRRLYSAVEFNSG